MARRGCSRIYTHTIELHHVKDLDHSDGMLVADLPKERIALTPADFNIPAQGQPVSPAIGTLVQNVDRLKLDFERHVLVHAPVPDWPMTRADSRRWPGDTVRPLGPLVPELAGHAQVR